MKKALLCLFAVLLTAVCFSVSGAAFDANDYDYGGGGGGYDYDYDYGGGYDYDDDDDYYYGGGSGGGSIGIGSIVVVVIIVIVIFGRKNIKTPPSVPNSTVRRNLNQGGNARLPDRTQQIEGIIRTHDPDFSSFDFISFTKRVYIDIQTAWCKRDLTPVRVFLHDNLYDSTTRQIQAKIEQGVIYHYESMVVNTAYMTSYDKDSQFEYLTIYLNARMIDWQEDEKTGNILRGDKTTRWDMKYKMKFMRSLGIMTKDEKEDERGHNCPNCGAPLEMTSSGKCSYCDSVVTTGQYSWVLSDFGTVRNDTVDEGISGV